MATVLVVDDVAVMRFTIKEKLKNLGHEVIAEAENGKEAVEQYKKHLPDFVTMDVTMPEVDGIKNGIDSLKAILEFDSTATVLMLTSHGEEKLVIEAVGLGAKGYILKPVNEEKIKNTLSKLAYII